MKKTAIPVALEGYPFILFGAFATLILALLELSLAAVPALILTGLVTWFFRDPDRVTPDNGGVFVAPADGKIIAVERMQDQRFGNEEVHKISIFMNVFNVHVNRFPFAGTVERVHLQPGKFYSADSSRGALQNEYCALTVLTGDNLRYGVVQVAGLIARRIVCWAEKGDVLQTGQRFGLIRFGSRVDLYLPLQVEPDVQTGDKVRAGETVIAHLTGPA
ncbi:MAG: phosphatidylserine decarboxylase family protein [Desulfobulbaceae bacterium]|jgi:phosphatidylserine decarboxylase|nr:phosphatidylserine decarboxylase family protein [Desulfobulbaceae bacterium]MDY0350717.1 phosphatidylserine decarboxylase family protein [Desulfobulbaceae bacterium]